MPCALPVWASSGSLIEGAQAVASPGTLRAWYCWQGEGQQLSCSQPQGPPRGRTIPGFTFCPLPLHQTQGVAEAEALATLERLWQPSEHLRVRRSPEWEWEAEGC